MARRSTSPATEQLSRAQIEDLRRQFEAMPKQELEIFYKATHGACRYAWRLPSPRLIQDSSKAGKLYASEVEHSGHLTTHSSKRTITTIIGSFQLVDPDEQTAR